MPYLASMMRSTSEVHSGGAPRRAVPVCAAQPAQHLAHRRVVGRVGAPGQEVGLGDRGQPPGQRAHAANVGLVYEVPGEVQQLGRHRGCGVFVGPSGPVPPVRGVGLPRVGGQRLAQRGRGLRVERCDTADVAAGG
jgi:hypothetical protein